MTTRLTLHDWLPVSGYSQRQLASRLGMHRVTLSELVAGRRWPNSITIMRIHEASDGAVTIWDADYFRANQRDSSYLERRASAAAAKADEVVERARHLAERAARAREAEQVDRERRATLRRERQANAASIKPASPRGRPRLDQIAPPPEPVVEPTPRGRNAARQAGEKKAAAKRQLA